MTKQVRIENADTTDHVVVVQVWQKPYIPPEAKETSIGPHILIKEERLCYPATLGTYYIWKEQYLVVKEE